MVFESYEVHFYRFGIRFSISLMICMLKYALTHIFAHTLLAVEISDRKAIRSQARQIAATDSIQDSCCCI